MNHSKKIWNLKKELKFMKYKNKILKNENYQLKDKIKLLEKNNNYLKNNLKNIIKEQRDYFNLIKNNEELEYNFIKLSNFIKKNKKNINNIKNLKECKICCNYILDNSFIKCPNINCNTNKT